jgi:membrane glycosyltransferase
VLTEVLLSALVAPIMMLVQTGSVIEIVTGRDSGWSAQARDAERVPRSLLWRFHRKHIAIGLLLALAAGAISWRLLAWMSPALVGLVLAMPLSAFMGSAAAGRRLLRWGLLETPEELDPPPLAAAADADAAELRLRCRIPEGLAGLLADPEAYRRHLAWLDPPTSRQPGEPDAALASALLKLADGLGVEALDTRETFAVLASERTLAGLAPRAPRRAAGNIRVPGA